jgi:class 3 adenylate cyclase
MLSSADDTSPVRRTPIRSSIPSGTVTFLFTDIEGSTRLAQMYPDGWDAARQRQHAILREAIEAQQGYIFQISGDAFCAAFHSAADGLNACLAAQRALNAEAWGEASIRVRMGLHTGEAESRGDDYHGYLALSRVQRLMSSAYCGQVLLSAASQVLVHDRLPPDVMLRNLGEVRLKDFPQPEHIYQLVAPDLPTDFPPIKTLSSIPNNLPVQLTSFVGRDTEMAEVK